MDEWLESGRIAFIEQIESARWLVEALEGRPLVRRPSLPAVLTGEVPAEAIVAWQNDEDYDVVPRKPPQGLRRSMSLVLKDDPAAVALRERKAPEAEEEAATRLSACQKLKAWGQYTTGRLDLAGKPLPRDDVCALSYLLRFNAPLHALRLSRCYLCDDDASDLIRALRYNYHLTELDLAQTKVTDAVVLALADLKPLRLKLLDLRRTHLTTDAALRLWRLFGDTPTLETLNGLQLGSLATETDLDLAGKELGSVECVLLQYALANAHDLRSLDLHDNDVDDDAIKFVGCIVEAHPPLAKLNLDANRLGSAGLDIVCQFLTRASWLVDLSLAHNTFADDDALRNLQHLMRHRNTTLTALDLTGMSSIPDAVLADLEAHCAVNRAIAHTPDSFKRFCDRRFDPPPTHSLPSGGYELTLSADLDFLRRERRLRPTPCPDIRESDIDGDTFDLKFDFDTVARLPRGPLKVKTPATRPCYDVYSFPLR